MRTAARIEPPGGVFDYGACTEYTIVYDGQKWIERIGWSMKINTLPRTLTAGRPFDQSQRLPPNFSANARLS